MSEKQGAAIRTDPGSGLKSFHTRAAKATDRIQGKGSRTQPPWVRGAAWRLTRAFYGLYDAVVNEIDRLLNAVPPPPPGVMAGLQAERAQLEQ